MGMDPGDNYLIDLLREGEADRVEFKESLGGDAREKLRQAICSFANDLPGYGQPGVAYVGVKDDRTVIGTSVDDESIRTLADMKTDGNILPPPTITVRKLVVDGHEIAVVVVVPSDSPPVRLRGRVHIRVGARRAIATEQDERILYERRRFAQIPFDIQPVLSATLRDLNLPLFQNEYLPQAFAPDILDANGRSAEEQLAATKMITSPDNPTPTVLGLLVLGNRTLDFLPGAYVEFLRFAGYELADPISDEEAISGSVADVLRRLDEKLHGHNRTTVDIASDLVERRSSTYPIPAIRQIAHNAVMHRSYEGNNSPVRLYWFNDRIEVISPGGVFGSVTADNFGQPGITSYRNPNLAEAMKNLGFVQRFGIGIPTAKHLLLEAGHPEMVFQTDQYNVLVTIRAKETGRTPSI